MGSCYPQQELHLQSLTCPSCISTSGVVVKLGCTLVYISKNNQPEIAVFSIASCCKDPRVQNIQGKKNLCGRDVIQAFLQNFRNYRLCSLRRDLNSQVLEDLANCERWYVFSPGGNNNNNSDNNKIFIIRKFHKMLKCA